MHNTHRRTGRAAAVCCALGALLMTGALASARGPRNPGHRARAASSPAYSALTRAPNAHDLANTTVAGAAQHDPALVVSGARVLSSDPNGQTWLIPTTDGRLCLALQPAAQYAAVEQARHLAHMALAYVCAPTAQADQTGIVLRTFEDIVGLVPDGVTQVAIALPGAAPTIGGVHNDTYRVKAGGAGFDQATATFTSADGSTTSQALP
jgi:hypothetical protein